MKYFITGATGTLGKEVVRALVQKGHEVKAGSRKSKEFTQDQGMEGVYFDYEDENTFHHATNVDGVFLMEPPALNPEHIDLAAPFLAYLTKNNPMRLVYLSSNGMETLMEIPFHFRMEKRIKESKLNWHIIRPSFYAQGFGVYVKRQH